MKGFAATYARVLVSRTWRETRTLFFQKTLKVFLRDLVLLGGGIALLYAFQARLMSAALVPETSNLALNKTLPIVFSVTVFIAAFAAYFLAELLIISPFRLWSDREPPPAAAAPSIVDEETNRLAGVVMALRDRVSIRGFKTPVSFDDPYFGFLDAVENSTHPIWIDDVPRAARIDFVHASKCLPAINRDHSGERAEIEHWRALVKSSSDELIRVLRGATAPCGGTNEE